MPRTSSPASGRRRLGRALVLEPLEDRQLLTQLLPKFHPSSGPAPVQVIHTATGAAYTIAVQGPGTVRARQVAPGQVDITLFGTTANSQVTVTRTLIRNRFAGSMLQVRQIDVRSGELGAFLALDSADLIGPISPLRGNVGQLQFDAIGPGASLAVQGSLGGLDVARDVILGPGSGIALAGGSPGGILIGGNLIDSGAPIVVGGSGAPILVGGGLQLLSGATLQDTGSLTVGGPAIVSGSVVRAGSINAGGQVGINASQVNAAGPLAAGGGLLAFASIINTSALNATSKGAVLSTFTNVQAGSADVSGDLAVNGSQLTLSGSGGLSVSGDLAIAAGGQIRATGDEGGPLSIGNDLALDGGSLVIDRDLNGPLTVGGAFRASRGGQVLVGRDFNGGLTVNGDAALASGGGLTVGRNAGSLTIGGDLDTSQGGLIRVGGNLAALAVSGRFLGQGGAASDLVVGLDLGSLQVLGGRPDEGGLTRADIDVAKDILGLDIRHGIFDSLITAGVLIDGGAAGAGGNIGPDGPVAVFDSEIRAGVQIRNLVINGDVESDRPKNPRGRPTRIVAGEDRQGNFRTGGNIDNFQILGALIDAVVAASVQPNGGNGTVTTTCTSTPGDGGFNTYDKPAGTKRVGQVGAFVTVKTYTAPPNDAAGDPTIDDCVLPGAINPSFAPPGVPALPGPTPETPIPLPSKSTVLGGVISTAHGDEADFAGLFAADTRGVFVGILPG